MPERRGWDGADAEDPQKAGNGHPDRSVILVVEDEVLVRLAVADYLRQCGYRVLEAKTGEEARAILLAGEPVEILFSDIDLGTGITGLDLARWTREHCRDVRIILTSGVMRVTDAMRHLCDRPLLSKPYGYDALAATIKALLGTLGQRSGA